MREFKPRLTSWMRWPRGAVMPGRARGSWEVVFIDACDKPSTIRLFEPAWPGVRPLGSVLTDNAVTHRDELAGFVSHVRRMRDACSVEIPVGNGIEWTMKLP